MALRTSENLTVGNLYTRDQLRDLFQVADATLNNGIFRPKNTDSVWLFVTEEKTLDRVQYKDHLDGDVLLLQAQTEGRTDHLLMEQATNGLEILVFHRMKRYEHQGAGFCYQGPFQYVRSFGTRPKSFVLSRDVGREFKYGKQTWRWALEAVQQLGGRATPSQIEDYILSRVPQYKTSNLGPDLRLISVNEYGRSAWDSNRSARRTDGWNPIDALFRSNDRGEPIYELYDPAVHGVWGLAPDIENVMRPYLVNELPEVAEAQEELQELSAFDPSSDVDARKKVLISIARRQGQPKFRRDLLTAYGDRCAVTGCSIREILEGAHIKPYRGDHTNHVKNGLLLRADIHTLFDLGLLRIDPNSWRIEIAGQAMSSYAKYHGATLRLPDLTSLQPDLDVLSQHYVACAAAFPTAVSH